MDRRSRSAALFVALLVGCGSSPDHGPSTVDAEPGDAPRIADAAMLDAFVPLVCASLPETCGSDGSDSCCTSLLVTGGTFDRSNDPSAPATVGDFRLDRYEITVGRFRQFVEAGQGTQQPPPAADAGARTLNGSADQGGWQASWDAQLAPDRATLESWLLTGAGASSWTAAPGSNEDLPIANIDWYEAAAFCAWDGGFLPTEAEWNYAAAGGSDQRVYPWSQPAGSQSITCANANYNGEAAGSDDGFSYCVDPPMGGLARVGADSPAGDGRWGHADLAGNVFEWVLDTGNWSIFGDTAYPVPCDDCAVLDVGSERAARGGDFDDGADGAETVSRTGADPTGRSLRTGARCARLP